MNLSVAGLGELLLPSHLIGDLIPRLDDQGEMVGYARYRMYEDAWALNDIYVIPRARRQGLASSMLEELLEEAALADQPVVVLVASSGMPKTLTNEQLLDWYRRHGFKEHAAWSQYGPVLVTW